MYTTRPNDLRTRGAGCGAGGRAAGGAGRGCRGRGRADALGATAGSEASTCDDYANGNAAERQRAASNAEEASYIHPATDEVSNTNAEQAGRRQRASETGADDEGPGRLEGMRRVQRPTSMRWDAARAVWTTRPDIQAASRQRDAAREHARERTQGRKLASRARGGRQKRDKSRRANRRNRAVAPWRTAAEAEAAPWRSAAGAVATRPIVATAAEEQSLRMTVARRKQWAERGGIDSFRDDAMRGVRMEREEAVRTTLEHSTVSVQSSAMRFWFEFAEVDGFDPWSFGALRRDRWPTPSQIDWEDEKLADFAAYVVNNPRKKGMTSNTGGTAAEYIAHVRTWYELRLTPRRRPGSTGLAGPESHLGNAVRRTLHALRKKYPRNPKQRRRAPVQRKHMVRIKAQLDLESKWGSMIWAFCTTAWQGGRRAGDLVRAKGTSGIWQPKREMHRGRVTRIRRRDGTIKRLRVVLGPDKTDPTGEAGHTMYLPYAADVEINAAEAIMNMMRIDPVAKNEEGTTPLFRDSRPGREGMPMTYGAMYLVCKSMLRKCGMPEKDSGCHSFRRGTATGLGHIGTPEYVLKMIGIWSTDTYLAYMDATSAGAMERAMLAMAEANGAPMKGTRGHR